MPMPEHPETRFAETLAGIVYVISRAGWQPILPALVTLRFLRRGEGQVR